MEENKRIEMIIEYARKVVMYPPGSQGYDPLDRENLKTALRQYDEEKLNSLNEKSNAKY